LKGKRRKRKKKISEKKRNILQLPNAEDANSVTRVGTDFDPRREHRYLSSSRMLTGSGTLTVSLCSRDGGPFFTGSRERLVYIRLICYESVELQLPFTSRRLASRTGILLRYDAV
jgi:hypothetical protein